MGPQVSKILQRESEAVIGVKVNIWIWRHVAIATMREHIQSITEHFARNEVECARQRLQSLMLLVKDASAKQGGHAPQTDFGNYAINNDYPNMLQSHDLGRLPHYLTRVAQILGSWVG